MYMMASFDCKFKTNQENIERILQHFGLRKIQPHYMQEIWIIMNVNH